MGPPLLFVLLGDGVGDPGSSDEVEQIVVATWSAHGSADPSLIASEFAEMYELLDLVEVHDEDSLSPGLQSFGKLEDKLGILE